jgi:hypothetical protein
MATIHDQFAELDGVAETFETLGCHQFSSDSFVWRRRAVIQARASIPLRNPVTV